MARIDRGRHRRRQIDVAEPHHEIGGAVDDAAHVLLAVEAVDAADELDVARAPRRVRPHRLRVLRGREPRLAVVPSERQVHDARRHFRRREIAQLVLGAREPVHELRERQVLGPIVDLQAAHAGRELGDARYCSRDQPVEQRLHAKAQAEIEDVRPVLDQQIAVAGRPVRHADRMLGRAARGQYRGADPRRRRTARAGASAAAPSNARSAATACSWAGGQAVRVGRCPRARSARCRRP